MTRAPLHRPHWGDNTLMLSADDALALRAAGVRDVIVDGDAVFKDGAIIGQAARRVGSGPHPLLLEIRHILRDWGEDDTTEWREIADGEGDADG